MLQTRTGKRTAFAALRIAVEMVQEKRIDKKTALLRIDPYALNQLLAPIFNPQAKKEAIQSGRLLAKGLNAGRAQPADSFNRIEHELAAETKSVLIRIEPSEDTTN
jgi:pyruvate,orthophosphate dikinase